jgi:drug/metabolite transporter (DMT)-like permease
VADAPLTPRVDRTPQANPLLGYVLVWSAVLMWSLNGTVGKVVLESGGLSAFRLSEIRATGSAALLFAIVLATGGRGLRIERRELGFLVAFGVCGLAFVQFFYFEAIQRLNIGIALVIQYISPVIVALWARFFEHEPVRRRLWFALALALGGLSLVVDLWGGVTLDGAGIAACLAGAFAYAAYIIMADHSLRRGRDTVSLLAWGFLFAAVFWAIVQPWWSFPAERVSGSASLLGRLQDVELPVWLLVAYVIVFGTVVPFILIVTALRHLSATQAIISAMLEPVLAAVIAYAWLGEELSTAQIVGAVLVLAGICVAQTARERARAPAPGRVGLRALEEQP